MNDKALEDFNRLCELAEKEEVSPPLYTIQEEGGNPISSAVAVAGGVPPPNTQLSKAYFYKAKALKKLNNFNDAILYFEQVIRMCDD